MTLQKKLKFISIYYPEKILHLEKREDIIMSNEGRTREERGKSERRNREEQNTERK